MSDQSVLLRRLRRLIDDAGHGHSQSAPGFLTTLASSGATTPSISVQIDGWADPIDVDIGPLSNLTTGKSIAYAIQNAVRNADPTLPNEDGEGWTNFTCRFDRAEGYLLQSGSIGSQSEVHVTVPATGTDVTDALKIGLHRGGFEDKPKFQFTDEELNDLLENSLYVQNRTGALSNWTFATLPNEYEQIILYRSWGDVVDTLIGRSAHYYPQKVASEEAGPHNVFKNFMELRRWIGEQIDEMLEGLESSIQVAPVTRYDVYSGTDVGDRAYKPSDNMPIIESVEWDYAQNIAILTLRENLTLDVKTVSIAYVPGIDSQVFDPSLLNEEDFDEDVALAPGAIVAKTITGLKNTQVRIEGLDTLQTYSFGAQLVEQNGNYYFSNAFNLIGLEEPDAAPFLSDWSLYHNGADQTVHFGDVLDWDLLNGERTFVFWYRPNSTSGDQALIAKQESSSRRGWKIGQRNGKLKFEYGDNYGAGKYTFETQNVVASSGSWVHVVICIKGKWNTNTKVYVNSGQVGINFGDTDLTGAQSTGLPLFFGGRNYDGFDQSMNAYLDEVAFFDRFFEVNEVVAAYNAGNPRDLSPLNPAHWWRMGDMIKEGVSPYPIIKDVGLADTLYDGDMVNMTDGNIREVTPW